MSARIAVLSDDRQRSEAWLRAINASAGYIGVHFPSGTGLRLAVRSANPHVAVIDQQMHGAMGLCADLTSGHTPRVIFVNVNEDDDSALDALASGARGIVYATAFPDE